MKALVLCNSDTLAMPAIISLLQQNKLHGVGVPQKSAGVLLPTLKKYGVGDADIHVLTKDGFATQLETLITHYRAEALFTITFPWLIPNDVLSLLTNRCINFHVGVLPKYKGADPIFWQIRNMEPKGGLSVHVMTADIDAGPLLFIEEAPMIPGETSGLHAQRLGNYVVQSVNKVLTMLESGNVPTYTPLSNEPALFFKKPTIEQLTINWQQQTADEIEYLINATNPRYGGAITSIRQMPLQILEVSPVDLNGDNQAQPGSIVYADATYGLIVACRDKKYLRINIVKLPEGYLSGVKMFGLGFQLGEVFN